MREVPLAWQPVVEDVLNDSLHAGIDPLAAVLRPPGPGRHRAGHGMLQEAPAQILAARVQDSISPIH
jgi:hypothetical protein